MPRYMEVKGMKERNCNRFQYSGFGAMRKRKNAISVLVIMDEKAEHHPECSLDGMLHSFNSNGFEMVTTGINYRNFYTLYTPPPRGIEDLNVRGTCLVKKKKKKAKQRC
jgi:hypothetical protein